MALEEASGFPPRKLPDTGLQPARCFAIIDIGKQPTTFNGAEKPPQQQVMLCFEMTKFMQKFGDKESASEIYQKYAWSTGDSAKLPEILTVWGGLKKKPEKLTMEFIKAYCGAPVYLNIVHSEDGKWANISGRGRGVNKLPVEITKPAPYNEKTFFEIPKDLSKFNWTEFYKLPKVAQAVIRKCTEFPIILQKSPEPTKTMEQNGAVNSMEQEHVGIADGDDPVF